MEKKQKIYLKERKFKVDSEESKLLQVVLFLHFIYDSTKTGNIILQIIKILVMMLYDEIF
jgi:hypothetical protein